MIDAPPTCASRASSTERTLTSSFATCALTDRGVSGLDNRLGREQVYLRPDENRTQAKQDARADEVGENGAVDVRKNFTISSAGEREGLDWVLVEPNGAEADFRSALFGFDHGNLKRMILEDKLDQTATIVFQKIERNGPVRPGEVSFKTPAGADVIGTPRK